MGEARHQGAHTNPAGDQITKRQEGPNFIASSGNPIQSDYGLVQIRSMELRRSRQRAILSIRMTNLGPRERTAHDEGADKLIGTRR